MTNLYVNIFLIFKLKSLRFMCFPLTKKQTTEKITFSKIALQSERDQCDLAPNMLWKSGVASRTPKS